MSRQIGLFGGTFDPLHNGHVSIAGSFLESGFIDELWVLLTPYPPHKQQKNQTSYNIRLRMLKEIFEDVPGISINTIENSLPKPSYSVRTVRYFKKKYPEDTFFFCMGEDSLAGFNTWKYYTEILKECELLVARRPEITPKDVESQILNRTHFVDHTQLNISSSGVREEVRAGKSIQESVPDKVAKIIEKEQLYT